MPPGTGGAVNQGESGLLRFALAGVAALQFGSASAEVPCGGDFRDFINGVKAEALANGNSRETLESFFDDVRHDPEVVRRDGQQGIFKKTFIEFSKLVMTEHRMIKGREFRERHGSLLEEVRQRYGVPPGVMLAFLALETDYGVVQGDFNTVNAIATLAHDCRRPELFRPHLLAAVSLYERGDIDPDSTIGAWAGEIGMIQMLPEDILLHGIDGDGDGRVNLRDSPEDALMTAGNVLQLLGWKPNQPWLVEIAVPQSLDWGLTGLDKTKSVSEWKSLGVAIRGGGSDWDNLQASILLPHGRLGPAFLAFDNYRIYFEWNKSFVYVTTSAFFATLLDGGPMYIDGNPTPPLSDDELKELQTRLNAAGYDVGPVDGIVGAKTRAAVQLEQMLQGLPADAWPTAELLEGLR